MKRMSMLIRLATVAARVMSILLLLGATGKALPASGALEGFPDLNTLFAEAEDEVQIKKLSSIPTYAHMGTKLFWVDQNRVIYNVRQLKDWQAQKNERSKIIIVNVDTGSIEETSYRGELTCYGTEGQILVQDYPVYMANTLQPGDKREDSWVYLTGKLGESLTRFKRTKDLGILDPFSCRFFNNRDHHFGEQEIISYLRPDDGVLVAHLGIARLVDKNGVIRWTTKDITSICNSFGIDQYLPWLKRYFSGTGWSPPVPGCGDLNKFSYLASTDAIDTIPLPKLIQEIRGRPTGAHGATYWARRGLYVTVQFSRQLDLDGLYWQDEKSGQLKRVLKEPKKLDHLSPDGCRNLIMGNTFSIIELCKGDKK